MKCLGTIVLVLVCIIANCSALAHKKTREACGQCDESSCRPPSDCLAGRVKDRCGCCYVCGRKNGELCDDEELPLPYRNSDYGFCGENLKCVPRTDLPPGDAPIAHCVCIKEDVLCGSDGRTYENECELTEARYKHRNGLRALHRGPCKSAPKIVSPPENVSNVTGGKVAMSCEAMGWPIPSIEWKVDRGDGEPLPLPSDDPKIAVLSRGGPSQYEITGWLQLVNLQPEDDATYWCIARSEEGEASAGARVVVLDANDSSDSSEGETNEL